VSRRNQRSIAQMTSKNGFEKTSSHRREECEVGSEVGGENHVGPGEIEGISIDEKKKMRGAS